MAPPRFLMRATTHQRRTARRTIQARLEHSERENHGARRLELLGGEASLSLTSAMGRPTAAPSFDVMGGPDRGVRLDLMGRPTPTPPVGVMGGPDRGVRLDLMGHPTPALEVDALGGPDVGVRLDVIGHSHPRVEVSSQHDRPVRRLPVRQGPDPAARFRAATPRRPA